MKTCTREQLVETLHEHFGGVISTGSHLPDEGKCCILEAVNYCNHGKFTDDPYLSNSVDIREFNDSYPDDDPRRKTQTMLDLYIVLQDWRHLDPTTQEEFLTNMAIWTAKEFLPNVLSYFPYCETLDDVVDQDENYNIRHVVLEIKKKEDFNEAVVCLLYTFVEASDDAYGYQGRDNVEGCQDLYDEAVSKMVETMKEVKGTA